jgi:hypothetical protein
MPPDTLDASSGQAGPRFGMAQRLREPLGISPTPRCPLIRNIHFLAMVFATASSLVPATTTHAAEVALLTADEVAHRA